MCSEVGTISVTSLLHIQDQAASDSWELLIDLSKLDVELSKTNPRRGIPASYLGAVTPEGCHHNPNLLCKQLEGGWRPAVTSAIVPSVVHVPWISHLGAIVKACGIRMERGPSGKAMLTQVLLNCTCILRKSWKVT